MKFIFLLLFKLSLIYLIISDKNFLSNKDTNRFTKFNNKKITFGMETDLKFKTSTQFKSLMEINLGGKGNTINLNKLNNNERFQGFPLITADNSTDVEKGPLYYRGWNKYFIINLNGLENQNKSFYINPQYKQEISKEFKDEKNHENNSSYLTNGDSLQIPDDKHFYFVITDEYMNTISSRHNDIARTVDTLELETLSEIHVEESGETKGGIQDLGNFQEGFCFVLKGTKSVNRSKYKWIVCSDNYENKAKIMKTLIRLRQRLQIKFQNKEKGTNRVMTTVTNLKLAFDQRLNNNNNIKNNVTSSSHWINLQDWSTCTLACGGGTQTLHRFCLKVADGSQCDGEGILTRPCNVKQCESLVKQEADIKILPTQIRVLQVSLRPQRFKKCELKEEDLDIIRFDFGNLKIPPRIPSRVVMNKKTISIFESGDYDSILASYYLNELKIIERYQDDPQRCLKIGLSKVKFSVICMMCNDNRNNEDSIKDWIKDINDFRFNCERREESRGIRDDDPRLLMIKKKLEEEDRKSTMQKNKVLEENKKQAEHQKTLKKAQLIALRTLEKESKYEERLEKEELMREEKEDEEMKKENLCEETKRTNLLKALTEKSEKEENKEDDLQKRLNLIEQDLKNKILENRVRIVKKIKSLRMSHERKKNKSMQQIQDVRRALSQHVLSSDRIGSKDKCINSLKQNRFEEYCNVNFSYDPISHADCKVRESFCYICCENEFGDFHINAREECTTLCDKIGIYEKDHKDEQNNKSWKEVDKLPGLYKDFKIGDKIKNFTQ